MGLVQLFVGLGRGNGILHRLNDADIIVGLAQVGNAASGGAGAVAYLQLAGKVLPEAILGPVGGIIAVADVRANLLMEPPPATVPIHKVRAVPLPKPAAAASALGPFMPIIVPGVR